MHGLAWIILVVRYARKGFLSSIVQLSGNLISLLGDGSSLLPAPGWVFEHICWPGASAPRSQQTLPRAAW